MKLAQTSLARCAPLWIAFGWFLPDAQGGIEVTRPIRLIAWFGSVFVISE